MAPHSKYVLVIYERSPDGSLTINTHTGAGMKLLGGCQTADDCLALAITWYDEGQFRTGETLSTLSWGCGIGLG